MRTARASKFESSPKPEGRVFTNWFPLLCSHLLRARPWTEPLRQQWSATNELAARSALCAQI